MGFKACKADPGRYRPLAENSINVQFANTRQCVRRARAAAGGNDERAITHVLQTRSKKPAQWGVLSGLWLTLRGGLWLVLNVIQKISAEASSPQEQERL